MRPAIRQPLCAPFSRRMRVSRRVSMSAMPTMPLRAQVFGKRVLGAEVGHAQRQVADHQAGGVDAGGFLVLAR